MSSAGDADNLCRVRLGLPQHETLAALGLDVLEHFEDMVAVLHDCLLDNDNKITLVAAARAEELLQEQQTLLERFVTVGGNVKHLRHGMSCDEHVRVTTIIHGT